MTTVSVSETITVPADHVWEKIKAFDDMDKILPPVSACAVTGFGPGATRICTLQDGGKLFERLDRIDEAQRRLEYSITSGALPVSGYKGAIQVQPEENGGTRVEWSAEFSSEDSESEMKALFEEVFSAGIKGFEAYLKRA